MSSINLNSKLQTFTDHWQPRTVAQFNAAVRPGTFDETARRLRTALPEAEAYLDRLLSEAEAEAMRNAPYPQRLVDLLRHTRALSSV